MKPLFITKFIRHLAGFVLIVLAFSALPTFGQTLTSLFSFSSTNGSAPTSELIQASDGNFYGTTALGGSNNLGTVFKITMDGAFTCLAHFNSNNGANPQAALIQAKDGNFYGTTANGGSGGWGTIFKMTPQGNMPMVLSIKAAGHNPWAPLIQASDTNFYGTCTAAGFNGGTLFKMTPSGELTPLVFFGQYTPASTPFSPILQFSDGVYYGTTIGGGETGAGTVYKTSLTNSAIVLSSFNFTNGQNPYAGLTLGNDGNLYGTCRTGGSGQNGTIFKVTPAGVLTTLFSFASSGTNGAKPYTGLTQGSDGNFYGVTYAGGDFSRTFDGAGTAFKITPSGQFTSLVNFNSSKGVYPSSKLIQGTDGNFYGVTAQGGTNGGYGTIFRLTVPLVPILKTAPSANKSSSLIWNAVANTAYQPQYKTNWQQANWLPLGDPIMATNGTASIADPYNTNSSRFYRILVLQ